MKATYPKYARIEHAYVLNILDYDIETGLFTGKAGTKNAGKVVGYLDPNGYVQVGIGDCLIPAHRLAWFYHYGVWPNYVIDHINGIRNDNRIKNLRDVTHEENSQNTRKSRALAHKLLGETNGVTNEPNRHKVDKTRKYLGVDAELDDAEKRYVAAEDAYAIAARGGSVGDRGEDREILEARACLMDAFSAWEAKMKKDVVYLAWKARGGRSARAERADAERNSVMRLACSVLPEKRTTGE